MTYVLDVIGVKYNYEIEFTLPGHYSLLSKEKKNRKKQDDDGMSGQMDNERDCGKCGHKGMSYTTMQLRSADEGQTVFYFCPSCKYVYQLLHLPIFLKYILKYCCQSVTIRFLCIFGKV
ncbi:UNVERIFIED_CONTAM: hypothetical protein GTU68_014935 [Idotea baltica]|nr:hypothetical protein [Idotea baltica]